MNIDNTKNNVPDDVDIQELLHEAQGVAGELREKLAKIKINIDGSKSPDVVTAIRAIFGEQYVNNKGNSYISYDMYCRVIDLLRKAGKSKAEEIL